MFVLLFLDSDAITDGLIKSMHELPQYLIRFTECRYLQWSYWLSCIQNIKKDKNPRIESWSIIWLSQPEKYAVAKQTTDCKLTLLLMNVIFAEVLYLQTECNEYEDMMEVINFHRWSQIASYSLMKIIVSSVLHLCIPLRRGLMTQYSHSAWAFHGPLFCKEEGSSQSAESCMWPHSRKSEIRLIVQDQRPACWCINPIISLSGTAATARTCQ